MAVLMLVLGAASVIVVGCGIEGQPFGKEKEGNEREADSTPVVSGEEIDAAKDGSPERAVLEWWRALQTRDARSVEAAYAPDVRKGLPDGFRFAAASLLPPLAAKSGIAIDSVEHNVAKKTAMVFVTIDSSVPVINGPLAVPVEKIDGEWLLTDDTFILALAGQAGAATGNEKAPADGE